MEEGSFLSRFKGYFSRDISRPHTLGFFSNAVVTAALVVLVAVGIRYLIQNYTAALGASSVAAVLPGTLLSLTNDERSTNGLPSLSENKLLDQAAQLKADDMAREGYFAHITPEGDTPLHFLNQVGYKYLNVGENLGLNYDDAKGVEDAWKNSPEHHRNVLLPQFTETGIGTSQGTYQGFPATFVVELFATPAPAAHVNTASTPVLSYKTVSSTNILAATASTSPVSTEKTTSASSAASTSITASQNAERIAQIQTIIAALNREIAELNAEINTLKAVQ